MKVIAIVGPTAVGKTSLSLKLAKEINAEIINVDAMQLYKGMDIGTAKLNLEDRENITHHLIDILDPSQESNVSDFQQIARSTIDTLLEKNTHPLLVGGSGLYVNSVLENLEFPGTDQDLRERLEDELEQIGIVEMFAKLKQIDPEAAKTILPNNARRIIRALEVIELTGKPYNAKLPESAPIYEDVRIALDMPRDLLDERITQRVHEMFEQGLVEETTLLQDKIRAGKTSIRALGYSQIISHLDGHISLTQAKEQTIAATKRFARRQLSWFRRDPKIIWLDATSPEIFEDSLRLVR